MHTLLTGGYIFIQIVNFSFKLARFIEITRQ